MIALAVPPDAGAAAKNAAMSVPSFSARNG